MATKLKNLKITKVDFVDEGANPDADIGIKKNRADGGGAPEAEITPDQRGIFKRMLDWFTKTVEPVEGGGEPERVAKGDVNTFTEQLLQRSRYKVADDIWNMCYALSEALCSALYADDLDQDARNQAMQDSILEFESIIGTAAESWAQFKTAGIEYIKTDEAVAKGMIKAMESTRDRLSEIITKATEVSDGQEPTNTNLKGDEIDMKFDKSKMTPAEKAMLEEFEKRYGVADDSTPAKGNPAPADGGVAKAATPAPAVTPAATPKQEENADDIYKGMSPAAKAELEALKKFREATEDKELHAIAKSYEIIGKKDEELFPLLKSLKATSEDAYNNMISALDSAKAAVEKSGIFTEVGKSGSGASGMGGAVKEAETKAAELMKSKGGMTREQAIDQILQADPELAKRYETEEE